MCKSEPEEVARDERKWFDDMSRKTGSGDKLPAPAETSSLGRPRTVRSPPLEGICVQGRGCLWSLL